MYKYLMLSLVFITFLSSKSFSQDTSKAQVWHKIETSIQQRKELLETQKVINALKIKAVKADNQVEHARLLYYSMLIKDQRTEDSLYFRNSAFMDSLLLQQNTPLNLKTILHLLLAERIQKFRFKYLMFKIDKYETPDLSVNYAAFQKKEQDSLINYHFDSALKGAGAFENEHNDLIWLSSYSDIFLFKPEFYDLVKAEQIGFLIQHQVGESLSLRQVAYWINLPSKEFVAVLDSVAPLKQTQYAVLDAYKNWMLDNRNDPDKFAFIESIARKYLYTRYSYDSTIQKKYQVYLKKGIESKLSMWKAHSIYQLSLILNEQGIRYEHNFDTTYKSQTLQALKIYQANKELLSKYPSLNKNLLEMERQILAPALQITLNNFQLPDSSIKIHLKYKNISKIFYRILKMDPMEPVGLSEDYEYYRNNAFISLLASPIINTDELSIPLPADHNYHGILKSIAPVKAGNYYLLFSDQPITSAHDFEAIAFSVSNLAAINKDNKLFVLDRHSGQPVKGAKISGIHRETKLIGGKYSFTEVQKIQTSTNQKGLAMLESDKLNYALIAYDGDTIRYEFNQNIYRPLKRFSAKNSEDASKFIEDNARLHIFTDRGIYKPGQTVFYKAILISKDPETGEMIIVNNRNFKNKPGFQEWLIDLEPKLHLIDPMNRKIDSVKLVPDDYGSFSGSFKMPKTASTGRWNIESYDLDTDYNDNTGSFQVEEYKRPSMELTMEEPKEMLFPGKPFQIKVKVKAFSGAILNNIGIKVSIKRTGYLQTNVRSFEMPNYQEVALMDTLMYSNEQGELTIVVNDSTLLKNKFENGKESNFYYRCEFIATDNTGESVIMNDELGISSMPIKINVQSQAVMDRQDLQGISVSTRTSFAGSLKDVVKFQIYRLPAILKTFDLGLNVDLGKDAATNAANARKELVYESSINTGNKEKLQLPYEKFPAGRYEIIGLVEKNGSILGKSTNNMVIFDSKDRKAPDINVSFSYLPHKMVKPGDKLKYYTAAADGTYSIYQLKYYIKSKTGKTPKYLYIFKNQDQGLQELEFKVPDDAIDQIVVFKNYVLNNDAYQSNETIYLERNVVGLPEIKIENYRRVLVPGSKQNFNVSIKTKDQHVAAQLMSVLYDASLDKLQAHRWSIPAIQNDYSDLSSGWIGQISQLISSSLMNSRTMPGNFMGLNGALAGRVSGLSIGDSDNALNEVVVVGYGNTRAPGSSSDIRIRGNSSIGSSSSPLIILNGVVFNGDLNDIDAASIGEIMVYKDAEAAASIYGARAAGGVVLVNTKGGKNLPGQKADPIVKIRKNFNETAFFFPEMYADKNGHYILNFTIPESVTTWNWKMLAHTKDAKFAYLEQNIYTQLSLMVQPHMPRALYQGDQIILQSRIANLDSLALKGTITCHVEDVITGEDLSAIVMSGNSSPFSIAANSSASASFPLTVPANQLNPLKIIIKATNDQFADAEEHIIPVRSKEIFVKQSIPVRLKEDAVELNPPKLPLDAKMYGLALSIDAKPQATLVNALAWLANYPFDCAEQTFNKLLANHIALDLMRSDKYAQSAFLNAKEAQEQEQPEKEKLPTDLDGMELPWLKLDQRNIFQQKQLYNLLDTINAKTKMNDYLQKLYKLQNADGGLSWFDGGRSDQYISEYILAGLGKLKNAGFTPSANLAQKHQEFIAQLISYNDVKAVNGPNFKVFRSELHGLYARSFWIDSHRLSGSSSELVIRFLDNQWKKVKDLDLADQALLIINTYRYTVAGHPLRKNINLQMNSIHQLAIEDETNGIRWKAIADADDLNKSSEETIALLYEAFNLLKTAQAVDAGLLKWLLSTKTDQHWVTSKGTAAAIGLLNKEKQTVMDAPKKLSMEVAGNSLNVSDELLNGNPYAYLKSSDQHGKLTIKSSSNGETSGAIIYYYFSATARPDTINQSIKLSKKLYRLNAEKVWAPLSEQEVLKVGEQVKVILSIQTAKPLKYVFLEDQRAAAFEPVNSISGYEYGEGISYYKSVRDNGLHIFAASISSGKSEISYELMVAQEGTFYDGPSVLQCMYQPAVTAYSNSGLVISKQK